MTLPAFGSRWTIDRELGRTPLGIAWLVHDEDGTPRVATRLASELVAAVHDRARTLAALRALAHVEHPALLRVVEVMELADGGIGLVTEHTAVPSVAELLARGETLPGTVVARAARTLADALDATHRVGRHHGAIAPAFVHVGEEVTRIGGVGVLEALVAGGAPAHRVADMMDARAYAPPEIARGGVDQRGDVYALGTTLYALLTGKPPFGGRTTNFVMAAVLADEPATTGTPRRSGGDETGETSRLTTVLLRAVEKAPDDRWPTMAVFLAALEGRTERPDGIARTPDGVPVTEPVPRLRGHGPRIAVLVAFAIVAFFLLCAHRT